MNMSLARETKGFNVLVYRGSVAGQLVGAYMSKEDALKFLNSEAILGHDGKYNLVCMDTNELLSVNLGTPAPTYEETSDEEYDDDDEEEITEDNSEDDEENPIF